jgi:hypothetical protein
VQVDAEMIDRRIYGKYARNFAIRDAVRREEIFRTRSVTLTKEAAFSSIKRA